jgi:hypothetical protein
VQRCIVLAQEISVKQSLQQVHCTPDRTSKALINQQTTIIRAIYLPAASG